MDIVFSKNAGRICSLFSSLHFAWNLDELEKYLEGFGTSLNEEMKKDFLAIREALCKSKDEMDFYFNSESKIFRVFMIFEKLWEVEEEEEYLEFLEACDEKTLRIMLVKTLIDDKLKNDEEIILSIAESKENTLRFIKELTVSKTSKWDLSCLLEDMNNTRLSFLKLLQDYLPSFRKLYKKHQNFIDEVDVEIRKKLQEEGTEFIKNYSGNLLNIEGYKRILLASSYYDNFLIFFTLRNNTEDCYLIIGPYHHMLACQGDMIEDNLKVLKNICDKTRFGIMKYIMDNKRYGQEIAEKFQISNASVTYHMQNLLFLKLVSISKKDSKVFYSLNKERIKETIRFLEKEFEL